MAQLEPTGKENRNVKIEIGGSSNMEKLINIKLHQLFLTKTIDREGHSPHFSVCG
jgi:hypothetical protein